MHIDDNQDVGIGTTFPESKLHVVGLVSSTDGFVTISDKRLKCDIHEIHGGLQVVRNVEPKRFRKRTGDGSCLRESPLKVGFVAQDTLIHAPESTTIKHSVMHGLNDQHVLEYDALIAYLWSAVRELDQKFQTFKNCTCK